MTAHVATLVPDQNHPIALTAAVPSAPSLSATPSKRAVLGGRLLSGFATLFLLFDGGFKLVASTATLEASSGGLGFSPSAARGLGVLELVCLAVYLFPRTAPLGAILWTGYLGGAIASHVRVGNPLFSHTLFPIYVAALLWGGLWLRDVRVRALLHARSNA